MDPPSQPPNIENFLLKDLDTGMKSYVTDQEWVEKPLIPTPAATKPPLMPPPPLNMMSAEQRSRSDELQSSYRTLCPSDHLKVLSNRRRDKDREFVNLYRWQRVRAHNGPVRSLEFNRSGSFLASGGKDALIKVWDVNMRLEDHMKFRSSDTRNQSAYTYLRNGACKVVFKDHTADITALSWSKNDFLLSASADKTIRLWHPRAKKCLRCILHPDIVTSVTFHPSDEQICISGTADGIVRMWHLKERKLLSHADTDDVITACAITPDGTTALVGTCHGRCKFYGLYDEIQGEWQFKYTTQLDVRSRRAKNAQGKKICGFRFYGKTDKVMVSSNDSRLRFYHLDDKSVLCKFMGHQNYESRYNASFSPDGRYVLCASESRMVHIWEVDCTLRTAVGVGKTAPIQLERGLPTSAKDIGTAYESFTVQETGQLTAAVFAPRQVPRDALQLRSAFANGSTTGLVIVTASDDGELRVFGCC